VNEREVANVLARVQLGDNRTTDEVVLRSWIQEIGDLDFQDAVEAVVLHRRESTDWLMPAHVRANVKLIWARRERLLDRDASVARAALPAPVSSFDRAAFDAETERWVAYYRAHPEER